MGEETKGAQRILESIGFRYSGHIDPFDGGPHFACPTDRIRLVREAVRRPVDEQALDGPIEAALFDGIKPEGVGRYLVGVGRPEGASRFRATVAAARVTDRSVQLTEETQGLLQVKAATEICATPI